MKKALARFARQSPAMVVAMLALFVALTGTAVATTSALITGKQIKNSSITGADVKNKSLTTRDFRGSVRGPRGLRGLTGATGAPGAKGDKGDKGDTGATGVIGNVVSRFVEVPLPDAGNAAEEIGCQTGEKLLGGGASLGVFADDLSLLSSRPSTEAGDVPAEGASLTHWRAAARNAAGTTAATTLRVWAVCGTATA